MEKEKKTTKKSKVQKTNAQTTKNMENENESIILPWKSADFVTPSDSTSDYFAYTLEELDGNDYQVVNGQIVKKEEKQLLLGKQSTKKKKKKKLVPKQQPSAAATDSEKIAVNETKEEEDYSSLVAMDSNWTAFHLHPLLVAQLEKMNFKNPTPIQRIAIPHALHGKDILGCAETGSGKTLAYGLPILSNLLHKKHPTTKNNSNGCSALIITPTRELTMQVVQHLRNVLQCVSDLQLRPRVEPIVGGLSIQKQERVLSRKPQVLVATVGRLMELINSSLGKDDYLFNLNTSLRFLVFDEADRMVDEAHYKDLVPLLEYLNIPAAEGEEKKKKSDVRQTFLFSATLLNEKYDDDLNNSGKMLKKGNDKKENVFSALSLMKKMGRRGAPELCVVEKEKSKEEKPAKRALLIPESLQLVKIECSDEEKENFLYYFLHKYKGTSIVFVNTINVAKRLGSVLSSLFSPSQVSILHANMEQKQRLKHLEKFKSSSSGEQQQAERRMIIATDVAARGIDIESVDHVIHFSVPDRFDTFIHRSGRSGRAGKEGMAVTLVGGSEVKQFSSIRRSLDQRTVDDLVVDNRLLPKLVTRVKLAKRIQVLEKKLTEQMHELNWKRKAAKDADLILSEDEEEEGEKMKKNRYDISGTGGTKQSLLKFEKQERKRAEENELSKLKAELKQKLMEEVYAAGQSRMYVATAPLPNKKLEIFSQPKSNNEKKRKASEDVIIIRKDKAGNKKHKIL